MILPILAKIVHLPLIPYHDLYDFFMLGKKTARLRKELEKNLKLELRFFKWEIIKFYNLEGK